MDTKEEPTNDEIEGKKHYGFKIGEALYNRLDKHIRILRHINKSNVSKGDWLSNALKEKLARESSPSFDNIPKERYLNFKVEKELGDDIEKRIELIKKFRDSYSRKQWVLEAIYEKLEKEEDSSRKILDEISSLIKNS